jgi:hypothetical protein
VLCCVEFLLYCFVGFLDCGVMDIDLS